MILLSGCEVENRGDLLSRFFIEVTPGKGRIEVDRETYLRARAYIGRHVGVRIEFYELPRESPLPGPADHVLSPEGRVLSLEH